MSLYLKKVISDSVYYKNSSSKINNEKQYFMG